jgi:hypothetical protein
LARSTAPTSARVSAGARLPPVRSPTLFSRRTLKSQEILIATTLQRSSAVHFRLQDASRQHSHPVPLFTTALPGIYASHSTGASAHPPLNCPGTPDSSFPSLHRHYHQPAGHLHRKTNVLPIEATNDPSDAYEKCLSVPT